MTCPICNANSDVKYRPFCSRRCADVDLGKWLSGTYAIPSGEIDPADDPVHDPNWPTDPTRH